ncbi:MAG: PQQ-binding-like beta-propeller repeat protein, partial [Solirubrobacteraceae bacterium]
VLTGAGANRRAVGLAACPTTVERSAGATRSATDRAGATGAIGAWPYPNVTLANTRVASGSNISSANVSRLREAWTFELKGWPPGGVAETGMLATNPVVQAGVVYLQDLYSNVYAIVLSTGKLKWECRVDRPVTNGPGPGGVAVAGGTVFGQSPTTAFALNAATGRPVWIDEHLLSRGQGTFGIQPQVANGRVYLASQNGEGPDGGMLLALNASNGRLVWKVGTSDAGTLGAGVVASGGAWEAPLVSADGSVSFGIGDPYQSLGSAGTHPAPDLYDDSDVNLDAATGKLRWYYQGVTNDFEDHDMQTSPIAASVNGTPAVIGSGKMGYVYAIDARDGALLWKTAVGEHNGHDADSRLALKHRITLAAPYTFEPGSFGGVMSNLAVAGGTVYVVTCNQPSELPKLGSYIGLPLVGFGRATGEMEAIDANTGKVEWDTKLSALPYGGATVANDLVFTTLYDGVLLALDRRTGAIVYRRPLPATTNSTIAIAGNTLLVPSGGPTAETSGGTPQLVAYTLP